MVEFDYYYGKEADTFSFYRVPKILFSEAYFKGLSVEAKVLYGLMLDRMSLSLKNQWIDDEGKVYINFSVENIQEYMGCSKNKAVAILKELDSDGGIGLVEKKRQGQGKPTIIYVKNFASREFLQNCNNWDSAQNRPVSESQKINLLNPMNQDSRGAKIAILESQNMGANNTNITQTDISETKSNLILSADEIGCDEMSAYADIIRDTEVISIKLDDRGNVEDARSDDYGVEKPGWLVLVLIKMEKLSPIIEQNFTGDYSFKIPALKTSDEKEILSLAINIAEALDTSHSMKIMHRDVKLENIFYDESRQIYKLGDFGIARITNQGSASTKGAGTLGYEAPEVEGGNGSKYSYQADIYSFGVTIYLLMNELKFPGSSGYHVNREVQYNPNAQIKLPEYGAEELKKYICSLIVFNPQERPKSMREVLEHLDMIYSNSYGERKSNKIEKKKPKMAPDVEILKTSLRASYISEDCERCKCNLQA